MLISMPSPGQGTRQGGILQRLKITITFAKGEINRKVQSNSECGVKDKDSLLVTGCSLLVARCWLLVAGGSSLVFVPESSF
jgi:hypothetical protein